MSKINNVLRRPATSVLVALTLAGLGLSACGGSSGSTSSPTSTAATNGAGASTSTASSSRPGGNLAGGGGRPSGTGPSSGGRLSGTGPGGRSNGTGPSRANSLLFRQALAKFAACLRQNGVNIPAPNTSGKGPLLGTKGIDTSSPQFRAAAVKCRGVLVAAFSRLPRAGTAAHGTGKGLSGRP